MEVKRTTKCFPHRIINNFFRTINKEMSWDVLLLKSKIDINNTEAQPDYMGDREALILEFKNLSSEVDFTDKSWGIFFDGQTSIEINIGKEEKVNSIMLHVRGGGNPFHFMRIICNHFKWFALDCSTGNYIDFLNPLKDSWDRWQMYRDKIIGS